VVPITASLLLSGQYFDHWVVTSGSPTIANIYSTNTTLTMPAVNVAIAATYSNEVSFGVGPWPIPGRIECEHYDRGVEGVAFHDTTAGNGVASGAWYRNDGPDFEGNTDGVISGMTTNFNIGSTVAGEWLKYSVNVAASGNYDILFRTMTGPGGGGSFRLEVDGLDVTGTLKVPQFSNWNWVPASQTNKLGVALTAGRHVLRLYMVASYGNYNWMEFTAVAPPAYALTVNSGTGSGTYTNGAVVPIAANTPPAGQVFDYWVVNSGSPAIANTNAASTTLTMSAAPATVTATYKAIPRPPITIVPVGTNLLLQVSTVLGATYVLESTPSVSPTVVWTPLSTNLGTGGPLTNTVPMEPGTPQRFFRYQVR
jgi:hypothetical protein